MLVSTPPLPKIHRPLAGSHTRKEKQKIIHPNFAASRAIWETLEVRGGWCHVIVTVGVNKQAQQPIFSAGSITHLARRLRLSAELTTIRQTPVVILQHTWAGEDLQGDAGSGWSALPTNAPQFKSHSLEVSRWADIKEDPLLCAPPCAPS